MLENLSIIRKIISKIFVIISAVATIFVSVDANENSIYLPEYVVFDPAKDLNVPEVLRSLAKPISFPLIAADKQDIELLTSKFDAAENAVGLAAPQIGISKRIIIFSVPDDKELKKKRLNITDTMPKTVWINPNYQGLEAFGYSEDYEGCFSVKDVAGSVNRYNKIIYEAYTPAGKLVQGTAKGFLARVIQHEIDHLNGVLFTDKVAANKLIPINEYRQLLKSRYQNLEPRNNAQEEL